MSWSRPMDGRMSLAMDTNTNDQQRLNRHIAVLASLAVGLYGIAMLLVFLAV